MEQKRKLMITEKGREECKRLVEEYIKRSPLSFKLKIFYHCYKAIFILIIISLILLACFMIKARINKQQKQIEVLQTLSLLARPNN